MRSQPRRGAAVAGRALLVTGLCVVALVVTGMVRPAPAAAGESPRIPWVGANPYVFAIGDSLLEQCRQDFGMGWRSLGYVAWPGATAGDMRGRLDGTGSGWPAWTVTESSVAEERLWFRDAGSLVIALGINDVKFTTLAQWRANIEWFMRQARGRPVQWFTVHNPPHQGTVDAYNAELRMATDRWPNLKLMDWDRLATADPGLLLRDNVHLATYREGCQMGRNRLIQTGAPAVPRKTAPVGHWYEDPQRTGPVRLNGWGAGYVPDPWAAVSVNVRVDWRHHSRFPVDRASADIWAQTASGRAFSRTLEPRYRGRVVCLDLVDARAQFAPLGCRRV